MELLSNNKQEKFTASNMCILIKIIYPDIHELRNFPHMKERGKSDEIFLRALGNRIATL